MSDAAPRIDIRRQDLASLTKYMASIKEPSFRAKQIYQWLWEKGATSFEEMTNLSKTLREKLIKDFEIRAITTDLVQRSIDGTIKCRYKLHDGLFIESVLIPVPSDRRYTVCVSSQVGCSLSCKFCATGQMKRMRNLDPGEIYDQVKMVQDICLETYDHPLTNIVYMGMGEPLLNYQHVHESINLITSPMGLGMSPKRITISTAGIAKMIRRLADDHTSTITIPRRITK